MSVFLPIVLLQYLGLSMEQSPVAFQRSMKECFQEPLHSLIKYLRRQVNLKTKMKTVCPTVSTARLLSIRLVY